MKDSDYRNREQASEASLGYYFYSQEPGRHDLIMSFYNRADPDSLSFEEAVIYMAHELGKAKKSFLHFSLTRCRC